MSQSGIIRDNTGGNGNVIGPESSVDGNIATFFGTNGQLIQDSGVAVSTIATKFSSVNIQRFTATGTYTPIPGMKYCIIECIGGGGGGGGIAATGAGQVGSSGGGGSGAFSMVVAPASTICASRPVSIGSGGTSGTSAGTNGGLGGTTSVTGVCSASGGSGGVAGVVGVISNGAGGVAGNGGTGLTSLGEGGGQGIATFAGGFNIPGRGARSRWGNAPLSRCLDVSTASSTPGSTGTANSGSGGSGGANGESASGAAGGAGGSGIVYIYEFA